MFIRPLDEQKCPLDIQKSIRPVDQQKCPLDIDICPFVHWTNRNAHWTFKCSFVQWTNRNCLIATFKRPIYVRSDWTRLRHYCFLGMANVTCPVDINKSTCGPLDKPDYVHWTFKCPFVQWKNRNVHWT